MLEIFGAALKKCQEAGISVIMCTGDYKETAVAIAIEAGIMTKEQAKQKNAVLTGQEFREKVGGKL